MKTDRKRFFDAGDKYSDEAYAVDAETFQVITPIIRKWKQEGYSLRELSYVIHAGVEDCILTALLDWEDETN